MLEFSPNNAMRAVDWRWERARLLAEQQARASRARDDLAVRRAWRFRNALNACEDLAHFTALEQRFPELYWAHEIHQASNDTLALVRAEIQARILARQSDAHIAQRTGYSESIIAAYADTYFDVRPRIDRASFVLHAVIGPAVHRGLSERDTDTLWKLYGYLGGPLVLDCVLQTFTNPVTARDAKGVDAFLHEGVRSNLLRKGLIAAQTMPVNGFTATEILKLYQAQVEIENNTDNREKAQASILNNIAACMKTMPWLVGDRDGDGVQAPGILGYNQLSAELRSEEMMRIAAGEKLPHRPLLEEMVYPEPQTQSAERTQP